MALIPEDYFSSMNVVRRPEKTTSTDKGHAISVQKYTWLCATFRWFFDVVCPWSGHINNGGWACINRLSRPNLPLREELPKTHPYLKA